MSRQGTQWIAAVLGLLALMARANLQADMLPMRPLRHLVGMADAVVLGDVVAGADRTLTMTVTEVLQGPKELIGRQFRPDPKLYRLGPEDFWLSQTAPRTTIRIKTALVFLSTSRDPKKEEADQILSSGLRILCENGDVLTPDQTSNPGPYYLHTNDRPGRRPLSWDAVLREVRADLPPAEQARAAMDIPDHAERNRAILVWLREHQEELNQQSFDRKDWGPLQWKLFERIMESGHPGDCWTAVELYTVQGSFHSSEHGPFCSPGGRQLLVKKALDSTLLLDLRRAALAELRDSRNLWRAYDAAPNRTSLTPDEWTLLIEQLARLLTAGDVSLRQTAVSSLDTLARGGDREGSAQSRRRVAELLAGRYRVERDNNVRIGCAESIREITDERFWRDLTGNPQGILVKVYRNPDVQDRLDLRLGLGTDGVTLPTAPTFLFERLDPEGRAGETRRIEATAVTPADFFSQTWTRDRGPVVLTVLLESLHAGSWRVTAEGTVDDQTWRSIPIEISLP